MNISNEDKKAAVEAGQQGVKDAVKKMEGRSLTWWERLVWVVLAFAASAATMLLGGCGTAAYVGLSSEQGMLSVSRGPNGAVVVSAVPPVVQPLKK